MAANYEAILVPGGGVRESGVLPPWVQRRLDLAVKLGEASYIVTLSGGTTHRPPPLDSSGFPIFESIAAAKYLINAGVPSDRILAETHSYDTIGNAFFSRVVHVDPRGMRRLLVITSDFHMSRTQLAFNWVYELTPRLSAYEIDFRAVADSEMEGSVLLGRHRKEQESLKVLEDLTKRITAMKDFHRWLFTEHDAYNAAARGFGANSVVGDTLQSY